MVSFDIPQWLSLSTIVLIFVIAFLRAPASVSAAANGQTIC
jgi:hypothetical protein